MTVGAAAAISSIAFSISSATRARSFPWYRNGSLSSFISLTGYFLFGATSPSAKVGWQAEIHVTSGRRILFLHCLLILSTLSAGATMMTPSTEEPSCYDTLAAMAPPREDPHRYTDSEG